MTTITSKWLTGNFGPVTEEVTAFDLAVTGAIPDGLDGRYLRNGPNPRGEVDPAPYHWFIGDGMVHGVRLRDGRAEWYRNRFAGGRRLGPGDVGGGPNTNVIGQAGRTWAIVEAGVPPVELTDELDTVGSDGFDGTLAEGYTAHPKLDPVHRRAARRQLPLGLGPPPVHRRRRPTAGSGARSTFPSPAARWSTTAPSPRTTSSLFDLPVTFDLDAAMAGSRFPYAWNPDHGARVGLLPREGRPTTCGGSTSSPATCSTRSTPTRTRPAGSCSTSSATRRCSTRTGSGPDEGPTRARPLDHRPRGGQGRARRPLDDTSVELPRHDERLLGRPLPLRLRHGGRCRVRRTTAAVKYDVATGTTERHDFGAGRHRRTSRCSCPGRPTPAEDEGWLLSYVYDATTDRSDLVILAADDFTGDPVATVHLPQRVPFGFHGNWVPSEANRGPAPRRGRR